MAACSDKFHLLLIFAFFAISQGHSSVDVCITDGCNDAAKILYGSIDFSRDPCDDFYQFACGKWLKNRPANNENDIVYSIIDSMVERQSSSMFEKKVASNCKSLQFLKRMYDNCMDTDKRNALKSKPIYFVIQQIGGWPMLKHNWTISESLNVTQLVIWSAKAFLDRKGLIKMRISEVTLNPYFEKAYVEDEFRGTFADHLVRLKRAFRQRLLEYAQFFAADANIRLNKTQLLEDIERVVEFDMNILKIVQATLNESFEAKTMKELMAISPNIIWLEFFKNLLASDVFAALYGDGSRFDESEVHIYPTYMRALDELLIKTDMRTLINWLVSAFVHRFARFLDGKFEDAHEDFIDSVWGKAKRSNRSSNCVSMLKNLMPEATGALYAREYVTLDIIADTSFMIENVKEAFDETVDQSTWLDDTTRQRIKEKSRLMKYVIGGPDLYFNEAELDNYYEHLSFDERDTLFDMARAILRWEVENKQRTAIMESKLNKTRPFITDPMDMSMHYRMQSNMMVFPAASLQYPFYEYFWPDFVKYSTMGHSIGHELSHGFETTGIQFDKDGQEKEWWTPSSKSKFLAKVDCFIDFYSKYKFMRLNLTNDGDLTKGENIADVEGLRLALRAYGIHLSKTSQVEKPLPGLNLTIEQSFFASASHYQCAKISDDFATEIITTNPHAIFDVRIVGSLSNTVAFTEAYSCPSGSKMNPATKCMIW